MNKELKELKDQLDTLQESIVKAEDDLFQRLVTAIFKDLPQVKSFGFKGWVPGFNDGDPCVFSANYDEPIVNGYSYYGDWEDGSDESLQTEENEKQAKKLSKEVAKYLNMLPERFYERHFGENFKVTVTPEQIVVDDYDCGY